MTDHSAALDWLKSQEGAMVALLEELVNTDSGSYDKAGVDAAGEVLKSFFTTHGIAFTTVPHETFGEAIRAELPCPSANDTRSILLLGHRDTVFPKGEPLRRPFRIAEGRGYGPGVMDMKGGLVMNAFVMAAFAKFGGHGGPLVMLVTSDEEIASPSSRPVIENEARQARAVFNSEPSKAPHAVVSGRKGGVFLSVMIHGKAAHSGANYEQGISAIEALAKKIPAWHALTDFARGVTVNVGLISGGQTVNTVAPWAKAEIDLRYKATPDRAAMIAAIEAIAHEVSLPGTSAEVTIAGEFLPLEETPESKALFALYRDAAAQIGFEVTAEFTGSCADSGLTASVGCPTICSVGPVGAHGHTPEEYVEIGSLVPCAQAMALAVAAVKL
jgi:glutamate carboxypeptidase